MTAILYSPQSSASQIYQAGDDPIELWTWKQVQMAHELLTLAKVTSGSRRKKGSKIVQEDLQLYRQPSSLLQSSAWYSRASCCYQATLPTQVLRHPAKRVQQYPVWEPLTQS